MPRRTTKIDYKALAGDDKAKNTPKNEQAAVESSDNISEIECHECSSCKVLANLVRTLLQKHDSLEKEVQELKGKLTEQSKFEINSSNEVTSVSIRIKELEKKIEDRTNRQLRKTLVFRNVAEDASEQSWSDTTKLVATKISGLLSIPFDEAKHLIDRCHRGGNPSFYKKSNRVRPIYVAMIRWDTCEELVKASRGQSDVFIDYKYGPLTTARRNMALKKRKELKSTGEIVSGFIKFPAVLMGKKPGEDRFSIIKDFSDEEVTISKKQ